MNWYKKAQSRKKIRIGELPIKAQVYSEDTKQITTEPVYINALVYSGTNEAYIKNATYIIIAFGTVVQQGITKLTEDLLKNTNDNDAIKIGTTRFTTATILNGRQIIEAIQQMGLEELDKENLQYYEELGKMEQVNTEEFEKEL